MISLRDVWDREPIEVMEYLVALQKKNKAILIRGNYEDLLERSYIMDNDQINKTDETFFV